MATLFAAAAQRRGLRLLHRCLVMRYCLHTCKAIFLTTVIVHDALGTNACSSLALRKLMLCLSRAPDDARASSVASKSSHVHLVSTCYSELPCIHKNNVSTSLRRVHWHVTQDEVQFWRLLPATLSALLGVSTSEQNNRCLGLLLFLPCSPTDQHAGRMMELAKIADTGIRAAEMVLVDADAPTPSIVLQGFVGPWRRPGGGPRARRLARADGAVRGADGEAAGTLSQQNVCGITWRSGAESAFVPARSGWLHETCKRLSYHGLVVAQLRSEVAC